MNTEEIQYWSNFYTQFSISDPSPFAYYIDTFFQTPQRILDVGCGNGRDSYYLASKGHYVDGIDASFLPKNTKNCSFRLGDMIQCNKDIYNVIYSRFTFHSITDAQQRTFLESIPEYTYLCIETRSDKGQNTFREHGDAHYRNLTNVYTLQGMLQSAGFSILELCEGVDLAPYKNENPVCIRVIAIKTPPT